MIRKELISFNKPVMVFKKRKGTRVSERSKNYVFRDMCEKNKSDTILDKLKLDA